MTIAPLLLVDGMLGFRVSSGVIIINLCFTRSEFNGDHMMTTIQPTVDLAMPIPVLRNIMATLETELANAEAKASITPHPTQQ